MQNQTLRRESLWLALAALVWMVPAWAFASTFELFGAGPRGTGLAGALTAAAQGGEAAFHNPAMLLDSPLAGAWLGYGSQQSSLYVRQQRPVCTGSYVGCSTAHPDGFSARAAALPQNTAAYSLGWNYPLGGVLRNRVAVGVALALPNGHLIRISGPDPQAPSFPLYEGMSDRLAFLFALAGKLTDRVWLGLGVQVLASLNAEIDLRVNPTNHSMDRAAIGIGLEPRARLTAGLAAAPLANVRLGLSFRQRISLSYGIPSQVAFGDHLALGIGLAHETLFTPDTWNAGASFSPTSALRLVVDATLARWSQAPDPSPQVSLDVQGAVPQAFGLQDILDVGTDTPPLQLGFRDTVSPALGIEWQVVSDWQLRAAYRFRPSPAPRASGPFKYLDSDTHIGAAGISYRFGSLAPRLVAQLVQAQRQQGDTPGPLHVDLGLQLQAATRRLAIAGDPNDPVGSLEHGGQVWFATLGFGGSF